MSLSSTVRTRALLRMSLFLATGGTEIKIDHVNICAVFA